MDVECVAGCVAQSADETVCGGHDHIVDLDYKKGHLDGV